MPPSERISRTPSRLCLAALLVLVIPACNKAEQVATPAESPSAAAAPSASAQDDATRTTRALALQKPNGSSAVDKEIEVLVQRIEKTPDPIDPWILLGRAWIRKARYASDPGYYLNAGAVADLVLSREPKNRPARNLRAAVLLDSHAFVEAKDLAAQILADDPDDLLALGTKADAALELGDFEEALASAQRLMDLKPSLPAYGRAGLLRWLQGDPAAAKKNYRAAMDASDPRDPEPFAWVLVEAAKVFWHEGDVDGADKGFDRALSAVAEYPPALVGKARVALAKGDAKRAAELAARAFAKSPLCETAWLLGDARAAAGDEKGAEEAYKRVREIGRASDKRTLAAFLASKDKDHDEALALVREEMKVRKGIHTTDVLAWALYRKGDFAAARKESDVARAHGTREPALLFHAGAIRIAQGEKKEGEKLVREALAMNAHFDAAAVAEAKKLLGEGG
ncbi:tetratricopeptide repeat protein [Polyangium sp. 6x1]|uniref:tetratricopeptide repeat protein n=1 Tax=Polyangium sp. 6x1 TaxID=3042689 RepID=UPI002482B478|nr:tetratricopeptide repeat protein [Polyangium sp. 6x1]MDI1448170.1 tetratricopeptide repeat protein [Polyangium sp. 6x1]